MNGARESKLNKFPEKRGRKREEGGERKRERERERALATRLNIHF